MQRRKRMAGLARNLLVAAGFFVGIFGEIAGAVEPRLRGAVQTKAGEHLDGWIVFDKEVVKVEKLEVAGIKGELREIPAADIGAAQFQVVGAKTPGLLGKYYRNVGLGGAATERVDPVVDFGWAVAPPMPDFPADNYSVRWEGEIESTVEGNYLFHAVSDDGVRLWIDNRGVLDRWTAQAESEVSAGIDLKAGQRYAIRLEYFEGTSTAAMRLLWTPPGGGKQVVPRERFWHHAEPVAPDTAPTGRLTENGLQGSFYLGTGLAGTASIRRDGGINFDWNGREPWGGFGTNQYSVRWEGEVVGPVTGNVTFGVKADDGVRLWVGDNKVIDQWQDRGAPAEFQAVIPMEKDKRYPIRMEYYQNTGQAWAELSWSAVELGLNKQIVPGHLLFAGTKGPRAAMPGEGVLLTGGTVFYGAIVGVDEKMVTVQPPGRPPMRLPRRSVGAILFTHIDATRMEELERRRPGCLIRGRNDFFEAEMTGIVGGEVEMVSSIFGARKYVWSNLDYIKLNDFRKAPANYEIRLKNNSVMRADGLIFDGAKATVKDNSLWWIKLHPGDVVGVQGIAEAAATK